MHKKIIILAAAVMLLPVFASLSQVAEPDTVWHQEIINSPLDAKFSPDGSIVAHKIFDKQGLYLRDAENGELIKSFITINGANITDFAFFPDSRRIAIATNYNGPVVLVFDSETGVVIDSIGYDTGETNNEDCYARYVAVSSDERFIAFVPVIPTPYEPKKPNIYKTVIWDTQKREFTAILSPPGDDYNGIAFSKDGKYFVINILPPVAGDAYLRLYSLPEMNYLRTLTYNESEEYSEYITDMAFSPNSKWIACSGVGGYVKIWDIETGELVFDEMHNQVGDVVRRVTFSN